MSLAPGSTFTGTGQTKVTAGAGQAPNFINNGVGFMNDGSIAINTSTPGATVQYDGGIAQSAAGAFHGTTTPAGTDVYAAGVRVSALGQIVYEVAVATSYSNGNGVTANGRFATN